MMGYFLVRLALDLLVAGILILVLVKSSRRFQIRKVKKPYAIYIPTAVSLVLLAQVYFLLAPKIQDAVRLAGGPASFSRIEVSREAARPGKLVDKEGEVYYGNPFALDIKPGDKLDIRYLPSSRFIVGISPETSEPEA